MVELKEPRFLLRDVSSEKLDEVHESGYYDYLSSPEYVENVTAAVGRMIWHHAGGKAIVLDVGCGSGALTGQIPETMLYLGFDASNTVLVNNVMAEVDEKSIKFLHGVTDRTRIHRAGPDSRAAFLQARIEEFCTRNQHDLSDKYDIIHFGNVLHCLIKPEARIPLLEQYVERFKARFIVISELERFNFAPLRERFELIEGETFHLNLEGVPDVKNHRKVEIYRTGVKRDG